MAKSSAHTIGWIGAGGRMGLAMAKRLLEAGHDLSVYNRTKEKLQPLEELGATVVEAPKDLRDRDIVFSTVSASFDLIEVACGPEGVLSEDEGPGLFVDCSSVSEEASARVRAEAARCGTQVLAAPVSGNAKAVEAGRLSIVVSGPRAAFETAQPYLEALADSVTYVGEGELARMVKICHNLMLGVLAQCMAEITVLAEKGGVPRHAFLDFINNSVLGSPFTRYKTPAFVRLDMAPTFTPLLLRKDMDLGLQAARRLGVPVPVTQLTRDIIDKTIEAGHKDTDFAVLLLEQAKAAGLTLRPENVKVDDGLNHGDTEKSGAPVAP